MGKKPTDIVITWVDPTDPEWKKNRSKYLEIEGKAQLSENCDARFRDWDTVKYLLRSIEKFTPWVRTVHFVTVGHVPKWMNVRAEGLNLVKHEDFIPPEYLPTFSSHTIELNLHRIPGLAEQFINVNDDNIFLRSLPEEYFFKNGLPRDFAVLDALISKRRYSTADINLTDIEIINSHFKKNEIIKANLFKWFNYRYGLLQGKTLFLLQWPVISSLKSRHYAVPYLKGTFFEVWEQEHETLNDTCAHRFRTRRDVNQWLFRYWRLAKGEFIPISPKGNVYHKIQNNNDALFGILRSKKFNMICINDEASDTVLDLEKIQNDILVALEEKFPDKSKYEI